MENKVNRIYSISERRSDAVVHLAGIVLMALAVPVLIVLTARWHGFSLNFVAIAIYGTCFASMIVCSALYHMTSHPDWKRRFQRLDHTAIYLKIAGTYTPFAVIAGPPATWLLMGIWAMAGLGIALKQFSIERFRNICLALYVIMGWSVVVVGQPLIAGMNTAAFILMIVGGLIYSVGVFFYLWKSLNFHNTIWHVHVLVASLLLYASVLIEIRAEAVI
jgi:hemolysin III